MTKEGDLKAAIAAVPEKSLAARLRKVMPDIDRRVRDGASHEAIVEALKQAGITLSLITFRTYLYRWRKTQERPGTSLEPQRASPAQQDAAVTRTNEAASQPRRIENKGDLVRLRKETEYDMEELARLGKQQE